MRRTKAASVFPHSVLLRPYLALKEIDKWTPRRFHQYSVLRLGVEQEVLAVSNPVSGSGAAESLFSRGQGCREADAEAHNGPGPFRQGERCPAKIMLCYEVGYDAFWLARLLKAHGIECLVIDPGSLQVNRRGLRVRTDRVDV